jgi:hypothetical protein
MNNHRENFRDVLIILNLANFNAGGKTEQDVAK